MVSDLEKSIIESQIRKHIYSIEWLDKDENVIDEVILDVIGGSANFDDVQSNRRSVSLTLNNVDKSYLPKSDSKMWINNRFRLKSGYEYGDGEQLFYKQGTYLLGNPSILSNPTRKEVSIQGLDKWATLDGTIGGNLKNKFIIPVNNRIDAIIKSLLEEVGETKYIIDECDVLTPYTVEKEIGGSIADILIELSVMVSFESYYDNDGVFRFTKALLPNDYDAYATSWEYSPQDLYLESTRDLKWNEIKNSIKVIGMLKDDGVQIQAVSQDTNIDSELSIDAIGERFENIEDDNIYTNELAQNRSDYELSKRIKVAEEVKVTIVPNFSHVIGDVISVVDENNGCLGNYVIQNISYNFDYDTTMQLGLWKTRDIS